MGALLLGAGAVMAQQDVAVQQQNLMKAQGKSMYVPILKIVKGEIPYDQAAVDAAITDLEDSVPRSRPCSRPIRRKTSRTRRYGSSQKIWQNKADFDAKVPPVVKAIADVKGKIKDAASAEGRLRRDPGQMHRLPRDLSRQAANDTAAAKRKGADA